MIFKWVYLHSQLVKVFTVAYDKIQSASESQISVEFTYNSDIP